MASKESPKGGDNPSFRTLPAAALALNAATDKLNSSVAQLEENLKRHSLGISSWVDFNNDESPDGMEYDTDQIGYAKVAGKWGVAIRNVKGRLDEPQSERVPDCWQFMEAPRHLRVWGVRKLPELIGKIIKDAGDFTSKIEAAAQTVTELSNQIAQLTDDSPDAGTSVQLVQQQTKTPEVLPAQKNPVALAQPNAFSFDVTLALQQAEIQQTITDTIKAFEATQQAIKDAVDQASAQYRFQTLSAVTMPAGTPPVRSLPVRRRR